MKLLVYTLYFLIGFVRAFSACFIIKHVFRWKLKKYLLFSFVFGGITLCFEIIPHLFSMPGLSLNDHYLCAIFVPLIWLMLTDRSFRSIVVSLCGFVFVSRLNIIVTLPVSYAQKYFSDSGFAFGSYLSVILCEVASAAIVLLIAKACKSSITEPMSVWNIVFIGLLSYFTGELTFIAYDGNGEAKSLSFGAIMVILLSLAFMSVFVVMTVKLTESRYYSTLNGINESYLNAQKDYYEVKQTSDNEIRRIRHDMKNHLICIRDLASQKKYDELENYINEISDTVKEADRLIHTGNGIVDAIVNDKAARARRLGIRFEWEGTVSGLEISAVDSCTLVSNLLDNAIEACEKVDVAKRYIGMSFRRSEHFLFMTCENASVRIVELTDGRPLSTKSDKYNHGFGLENISRCVRKYGGELRLSSELREDTPYFIAEAVIPL